MEEAYLEELRIRKNNGGDLKVKLLPCAKIGQLLTLGPVLDKQVQAYLLDTCKGAGSDVAIGAVEGIVCKRQEPFSQK